MFDTFVISIEFNIFDRFEAKESLFLEWSVIIFPFPRLFIRTTSRFVRTSIEFQEEVASWLYYYCLMCIHLLISHSFTRTPSAIIMLRNIRVHLKNKFPTYTLNIVNEQKLINLRYQLRTSSRCKIASSWLCLITGIYLTSSITGKYQYHVYTTK